MGAFRSLLSGTASLALALLLWLPQAHAQDFYHGKSVTLFAGQPPGGGIDSEMRLVAQFFGKHIPGEPAIVPRNMPGAGGMILGNHLFGVAKPDGLTLGMPGRSGFVLAPIVSATDTKYDLRKFTWIGSSASSNFVLWMRRQSNIKSFDDLRNAKRQIIIAGSGSTTAELGHARGAGQVREASRSRSCAAIRASPMRCLRSSVARRTACSASVRASGRTCWPRAAVVPVFQLFDVEPNLPVLRAAGQQPEGEGAPRALERAAAARACGDRAAGAVRRAHAHPAAIISQDGGEQATYLDEAMKRGFDVGRPNTGEEIAAYVADTLMAFPAETIASIAATSRRSSTAAARQSRIAGVAASIVVTCTPTARDETGEGGNHDCKGAGGAVGQHRSLHTWRAGANAGHPGRDPDRRHRPCPDREFGHRHRGQPLQSGRPRSGEVQIPPGARTIDVRGKTVLPGFIDGHCHWESFWGEVYLHLGITTCVQIETQQNGPWGLAQKEGTEMGRIRGPRLWPTGQAIGAREGDFETEGSRAWRGYMKVPSAEAARAIVQQKKKDGYDALKVSEFLTPDMLAVITDEAHKLGMGVTGHSWDVVGYANAGIDGIEHIWSVGYSSILDLEKRRKLAVDRTAGRLDAEEAGAFYEVEGFDTVIKALVEHKVAWTPTIAKWLRPFSPSAERFWKREQEILANPKARFPAAVRVITEFTTEKVIKRYKPEQLERAKLGYQKANEFIRRFVAAGGTLKEGSDSATRHGRHAAARGAGDGRRGRRSADDGDPGRDHQRGARPSRRTRTTAASSPARSPIFRSSRAIRSRTSG